MKLIANRQLTGAYGTVAPGEEFECADEIAGELLRAYLVRPATPPRVTYETKVIWPAAPSQSFEAPEVSARLPFRDVPVPDAESKAVAPESHSVLPDADVPKSGAIDSRGRGRRARSGAGNGLLDPVGAS